MDNLRNLLGLTIMEFLVSLAILAVLSSITVASYQSITERKRLNTVIEELNGDLKLAHSESIKRQADIFISFKAGNNWCYGIDDTAVCDCNLTNDCQISGVEKVVNSTDFTNTSLAINGFTVAGTNTFIRFEGIRGLASDTGIVTFSRQNLSASISMNKTGLMQTCSNDLVSLASC